MNALRLGAPSLTGRDAQELVAEQFSAATYPLKIKISSLVSIMLVFPAAGVSLKPVGHHDEDLAVTTIRDFDQFQRLASDIGQIAELWGKEELVEIAEYVEEEVSEASEDEGESQDSGDQGDGEQSGEGGSEGDSVLNPEVDQVGDEGAGSAGDSTDTATKKATDPALKGNKRGNKK